MSNLPEVEPAPHIYPLPDEIRKVAGIEGYLDSKDRPGLSRYRVAKELFVTNGRCIRPIGSQICGLCIDGNKMCEIVSDMIPDDPSMLAYEEARYDASQQATVSGNVREPIINYFVK